MYYLLFSAIIFLVYGSICLVSLIFTFSIESYNALDEKLRIEIFSTGMMTSLDKSAIMIDNWILDHNKIIGPLLMILSIIDMRLFFRIAEICFE